ncbi:MAG: L-erythro-3,5-diaminohexanoate dehydrogenase, partial [Bacilli bacterium]
GMLIGTIKNIGKNHPDKSLKVGMKIATLVSLTLTPLFIKKINKVNIKNEQVEIEGTAYLFATGIYAVLPDDIPEKLALAALDVAGAPAQVNKLVKKGDIVYILGAGGKSGLLCCYQAKKNVGKTGLVIAVEYREDQKQLLLDNNLADIVLIHDARNAHGLYKKVIDNNLPLGDVVINVVNINNTENASILLAKDEGLVYFFSMATSFTKAALGAEGVGSDVTMLIGNGYTKNHANFTLDIIRESEFIRKIFMEKYV